MREFSEDEAEVGDAYATLCVHAGIAAADVLCCIGLGQHAAGENHNEALTLLARVRPKGDEFAKALGLLLSMKTRAGYSAAPVTADDRTRAQRNARRLVEAARDRYAGR